MHDSSFSEISRKYIHTLRYRITCVVILDLAHGPESIQRYQQRTIATGRKLTLAREVGDRGEQERICSSPCFWEGGTVVQKIPIAATATTAGAWSAGMSNVRADVIVDGVRVIYEGRPCSVTVQLSQDDNAQARVGRDTGNPDAMPDAAKVPDRLSPSRFCLAMKKPWTLRGERDR